jgi:mannan endo-1,4-beta-mannosidase
MRTPAAAHDLFRPPPRTVPDDARVGTARKLLPLLAAGAILATTSSGAGASRSPQTFRDSFVTRSGPRLVVNGRQFRFGGANVEWLGVAGYGPSDPSGPHFPSHYEVDDAMATAREMGATVVRSQTMGDSAGCAACIEPELGRFNEEAFAHIDYALASARAHGIKIIPTIIGDDAVEGGTGCVYLRWRGISQPGCSLINMAPFWNDPTVIGDVEAHVAAVLNHVNVYTHVAYKDDPTILGWDLLNGGGSPVAWTREIVSYIRGIDARHLILSGYANAGIQGVDACVSFVYPHWRMGLAFVQPWIAQWKPYIVYEYGWDRTNYSTLAKFTGFLETLRHTPEIVGDGFWALESHNDGHGWMPIPANTSDPAEALHAESGQWWALYYPGIRTLVSTAADMSARAQAIRRHNYAMSGARVPAHAIPPAPIVTSILGGRVYWQGSAGAKDYSIQRAPSPSGPWKTVCPRCATDSGDGYSDVEGANGAWYRVIPYNLDGKRGPASNAMQAT